MTVLDTRLHAYRPDLADARLRGKVNAASFTEGCEAQITAPVADLRAGPRPDAGLNTQLLYGDSVRVFEKSEGWAWVQAQRDGYVGYLADTALGRSGGTHSHIVTVPRTFVYPGPDMKLPRQHALSMGSVLEIAGFAETRGTRYALLRSGEAVIERHVAPIGTAAEDYVSIAELLLHTPYLWGGNSAFGLDCSGLVQLSMRMAGRDVLRDSDMQAASVGTQLDPGEGYRELRRGDLVFWKGHVAIMADRETIIHANGHTMSVALEPLHAAIARIAYLYGAPTGFRRP